MEGTGANLRLPLEFRRLDGAFMVNVTPLVQAHSAHWLCRVAAARSAVRPGARLGCEPAPAVHAAVERVCRISADVVDVGQRRVRRSQREVSGRRQSRGTSRCPVSGDPSTWVPLQQRRPLFATAPLITNISTTAARGRSDYNGAAGESPAADPKGLEYLASYTLERSRTNNLGYYGSAMSQAEGAYWMNAYEPEWNYGPAFFDARHNFVFRPTTSCHSARVASGATTHRPRRSDDRRVADERDVPSAQRVPDHGDRRPRLFAAGHARQRAAELRRRPGAVGAEHYPLARHQRIRRACHWHLGQLSGIGVARAPGYQNVDAVLAEALQRRRRARTFEFRPKPST